jgi:glutamine synthetase
VLHAPENPMQLSEVGGHFIAGLLHHLPAVCAITAPSVASYYRLRPGGWAPALNNVGVLDRGAAVRICPGTLRDPALRAQQFNLEYRVADATASPYLALAILVQAGLEGVRARRELEQLIPQPLPSSLSDALSALARSEMATEALGSQLLRAYVQFKHAEIQSLEGLNEDEICRRYSQVY